MSFDCSWLGYHGVRKQDVLAIAGFRDTGQPEDVCEGPACCAEIPTGWTILYVTDSTFTLDRIGRLSANHGVLSVVVQEYVPLSIASFHVRSEPVWTVTHDGGKGPLHLETTGRPPPELGPIRDHLVAKQRRQAGKGVDHLFDVPIELAAAICGFRHDRYGTVWDTLASMTPEPNR